MKDADKVDVKGDRTIDALLDADEIRELSWQIFHKLEEKGCGIGNVSVFFIEDVIEDFLAKRKAEIDS